MRVKMAGYFIQRSGLLRPGFSHWISWRSSILDANIIIPSKKLQVGNIALEYVQKNARWFLAR